MDSRFKVRINFEGSEDLVSGHLLGCTSLKIIHVRS